MKPKKLVAVKYDKKFPAPYILGKAEGYHVERALKLAKSMSIPIHVDSQLTEGLFTFPTDTVIPEKYFEIMAKILSAVYQVSKEKNKNAFT